MIKTFKLIFVFLFSVSFGLFVFIIFYINFYHQDIALQNPLLPATHFSLENAPKDSLKGKVSSISGNVAWISRTSLIAKLINTKIDVGQGEEIVTQGNGNTTLLFPEGLEIDMLPNSDVSIIQTLPVNLVFAQNQGDVIYEIQEDTNPVSINALDLLIKITNGQSQIKVDKQKQQVELIIASGSATIAYTDTNNLTQVKSINNQDVIIFDNNTKTTRISSLQ